MIGDPRGGSAVPKMRVPGAISAAVERGFDGRFEGLGRAELVGALIDGHRTLGVEITTQTFGYCRRPITIHRILHIRRFKVDKNQAQSSAL